MPRKDYVVVSFTLSVPPNKKDVVEKVKRYARLNELYISDVVMEALEAYTTKKRLR